MKFYVKIHTTEMGIERIKRNLDLNTQDIVEWCKNKILSRQMQPTSPYCSENGSRPLPATLAALPLLPVVYIRGNVLFCRFLFDAESLKR